MDVGGEEIEGHPLTALLRRPNPFYAGTTLWAATVADLCITGNAFWLKRRSRAGRPSELWYAPSWTLRPRWPSDGSQFIGSYEYSVDGNSTLLDPSDVVHFREGLDPVSRLGVSPLATALGDIFADDETTKWTGSLLRNMGVPGVILSPDPSVTLNPGDAERVKEAYETKFGGTGRGSVMVMEGATKVAVLAWSPAQMDLRQLSRKPEERTSALLGVPAIVAGLGAGLDRSTFANFEEARAAAYYDGLVPRWRNAGADLTAQLLPDFGPDGAEVEFAIEQVRALSEDENQKADRITKLVAGSILTVAEGRKDLGYEVLPEHEVYVVSSKSTIVPKDEYGVTPEPVPAPMPELGSSPSPLELPAVATRAVREAALSPEEIERLFEQRLALVSGNGNGSH
jgi:HK97 family phage portal protein